MSNKLDPDQAQHYAGPDLDPVYLRGLRADDTSRQLVDRLLSTGSLVRHRVTEFERIASWYWPNQCQLHLRSRLVHKHLIEAVQMVLLKFSLLQRR